MDFTQYDDTLFDNPLTPKFYEDGLREEGIIGNDEAVKAVATLFYKTGEGLPGTMLIAGPTGSGKTELFRALRRFTHEDLIKIVDATAITPAGFKGDFKITNLIKDLASPGILVLDEADKMLEPHTGGDGTNYTDMLQNALLKITDGDDKVLISKDDGSGAMAYVDTSRISVVFVGAFQRLLEKKSLESGGIGFGNTPRHKCDYSNTTITQEDLVGYGMREELAGRIQQIICLDPLNLQAMRKIGQNAVKDIARRIKRDITIDTDTLNKIANEALKKQFGARWLKSEIIRLLDAQLYEDPNKPSYTLAYRDEAADIQSADDELPWWE